MSLMRPRTSAGTKTGLPEMWPMVKFGKEPEETRMWTASLHGLSLDEFMIQGSDFEVERVLIGVAYSAVRFSDGSLGLAAVPSISWGRRTLLKAGESAGKSALELARGRVAVIGPSTPMWEGLLSLGIEYLFGARVRDPKGVLRTVAEAGGTKALFRHGLEKVALWRR